MNRKELTAIDRKTWWKEAWRGEDRRWEVNKRQEKRERANPVRRKVQKQRAEGRAEDTEVMESINNWLTIPKGIYKRLSTECTHTDPHTHRQNTKSPNTQTAFHQLDIKIFLCTAFAKRHCHYQSWKPQNNTAKLLWQIDVVHCAIILAASLAAALLGGYSQYSINKYECCTCCISSWWIFLPYIFLLLIICSVFFSIYLLTIYFPLCIPVD